MMMSLLYNEMDLLLPYIYLLSGILILLICGTFIQSTLNNTHVESYHEKSSIYMNYLGLQTLFFTIMLYMNSHVPTGVYLNGLFLENYFTIVLKILVLLSALGVMFMAFQYINHGKFHDFEFNILLLLSVLAMLLLISAHDLTILYVAIELQSLSSYILAALKRDSQFSTEAGLKYFTLGSLASAILLLGIAFIYGLTGSTEFEEINHVLTTLGMYHVQSYYFMMISIIFIFIAFLFKLAAAPFHIWAPDVYEGSPTIITAFFAIVPKIVILSVLIQLSFNVFQEFMSVWQMILVFSAMTSMLVGAWGAILQKKIKRFLAYSSIGHVGYILVGLTVCTVEGLQATMIYMMIYIIMSLTVFAIVLSLYKINKNEKVNYISELTGLSKENPLLAFILSLTMFSMAGIPPLAGFVSKFEIFYSAINSGFILLAIVGVLTSVIAAVYYIRMVKIMYFETLPSYAYETMDMHKSIMIAFTFLITLLFMINPSYVLLLSETISLSLSF